MINFSPKNYVNFQGGLKKNLRKSEDALREYNREFPYVKSSTLIKERINNLERKNNVQFHRLRNFEDSVRTDIMTERINSQFYFVPNYDLYKKIVKKCMKDKKIGNCGECADMTREYLKKDFPNVKVLELTMFDEEKNHVFCVVGMDQCADIKRPSTWGNKAVIVDGWRNIVASANDGIREYEKLFNIEYSERDPNFCINEVEYYD